VLKEGEELVYNVRYGFFDLGQVRIKTLDRFRKGNTVEYHSRALIDSYRKVPFVNLHAVFDSDIDSAVYAHEFVGKIKEDDSWNFARYLFDYPRDRVLLEIGQKDTVVSKRETLEVRSPYQDGLSLFFYARDQLFARKHIVVPTLVKEQKVTTRLDLDFNRTSVEIDAINYPVDVIEFNGSADFVGIFGLTGDFEGWFSNDEARVPIKAKMKVIIGSVTIELMEWKREGWSPPKASG
jgi:hypothetical protein